MQNVKRFFTSICLCFMFLSNVFPLELYRYVSDSGHDFYYIRNRDCHAEIDIEVIEFVNAQIIGAVVSTGNQNYNEDEIIEDARLAFKDSIMLLYNKNREYMYNNFPEQTYTFDEVYSIVSKFTTTMVTIGLFGDACSVNIEMNIKDILSTQWRRDMIEEYPYILGYLYKGVKYYHGKKCKDITYNK